MDVLSDMSEIFVLGNIDLPLGGALEYLCTNDIVD
jgi:hypothetical protein